MAAEVTRIRSRRDGVVACASLLEADDVLVVEDPAAVTPVEKHASADFGRVPAAEFVAAIDRRRGDVSGDQLRQEERARPVMLEIVPSTQDSEAPERTRDP